MDGAYIRPVRIIDTAFQGLFQDYVGYVETGRFVFRSENIQVVANVPLHVHTHKMFPFSVQRNIAVSQKSTPLVSAMDCYYQFVLKSQKIVDTGTGFDSDFFKIPVLQPGTQITFFQLYFNQRPYIPPFFNLNNQGNQFGIINRSKRRYFQEIKQKQVV